MRNFLIVVLLLVSSSCWAQSPSIAKADTGKKVQTVIEHMPEFPGGEDGLMKFLSKKIKYPKAARQNKIEGGVVISFIVNEDGSLSDINIMTDIAGGCGDEVVRVMKHSPKWKPGTQNGDAVRVKYLLPVSFELPKD